MNELTPGLELGARFVLLRRLGRGGTAEVWLAEDRSRGLPVALKVLSAAGPPVAGVAAQLAHQHLLPAESIVALHEMLELDGHTLLVMDYLDGGDLGQFRGRPFDSWAGPMDDVIVALAAVHAAGLVHRDLKCGNVLLDANGRARLADFGLMSAAGTRAHAGGSPYNASPQQLRGEPAQPADDFYALGALLYELIAGHPPYYPEITRERSLYEPVPPLLPLAPTPVRVRELTLRLLAKSAAERPRSLDEVRAVLAAARANEPQAEPAPAATIGAPQAPPPPARQGWRWLLAAAVAAVALAAVFVGLPRWTAERNAGLAAQARAEAAAQHAEQQQRAREAAGQAAARDAAGTARDGFQEAFAAQDARQAARWAAELFARARAAGEEAARGFGTGNYAAATAAWQDGTALLARVEQERPAVVRRQLALGAEALREGRTAEGREAFELALAIEPGHAAARAGLERAGRLEAALATTDAASNDERAGHLDAAEQGFRRALETDPAVPGAQAGLARIAARRAGDAYAAAMAQGMADLAAGRTEAARAQFSRALQLRPGSVEAQEAQAGLEQGQRGAAIGMLAARAASAEIDERWAEAVTAWREAAALEPALASARDGIARSAPRAELQERIDTLVNAPERLWDPRGRAGGRALLQAAGRAAEPRRRLAAAAAELERLIVQAEMPLRLRLESDGLTEVVIWRIGRFGLFTGRDVELLPGRYTVVGTRNGYRDVRREVELRPGVQPAAVVIRCEEPV